MKYKILLTLISLLYCLFSIAQLNSNGLTSIGSAYKLGGGLSEHTVIDGGVGSSNFNLSFERIRRLNLNADSILVWDANKRIRLFGADSIEIATLKRFKIIADSTFHDSKVQFSKYKNNAAKDFVLSVDTLGNLELRDQNTLNTQMANAFTKAGNKFHANGILGTLDTFGLDIRTKNITRVNIDTNGLSTFYSNMLANGSFNINGNEDLAGSNSNRAIHGINFFRYSDTFSRGSISLGKDSTNGNYDIMNYTARDGFQFYSALLGSPKLNSIPDLAIRNGGLFRFGLGRGLGDTAEPSAAFQFGDYIANNGSSKGFLLPRFSTYGRNQISLPADGLIVYNKETHNLEIFKPGGWQKLRSISIADTTDNSGQWNLTGNLNATLSAFLGTSSPIPLYFATNNIRRTIIDTSGKMGIGTLYPSAALTVQGSGSIPNSAWVSSGSPLFSGFGENIVGNADYIIGMASAPPNARPAFLGKRSRGTLASPTVILSNDQLFSLLTSGYDGTAFQNSAAVDFYVDGTPSSGNVPARISFVTGTNSSNRTERLKIASGGDVTITGSNLIMGSSTKTIQFATPIAGSSPMLTMFSSGTQNIGRMVIEHSPANTNTGLRYSDTLDQFDFVSAGISNLNIDLTNGNTTVKNKLAANILTTLDTTMLGGRIGIAGPTGLGVAANINASASLNGINISDPVNNYVLNNNKSGTGSSVILTKSSRSTLTPVISLDAVGSGLESHSKIQYGAKLTSDSSYGIYASSITNYAGYFNGNVYTTGIYQSSDEKLKKNIKPLENALEIINRLQPKTYEYKDEGVYQKLNLPKGKHYGLLAQDVEKVFPEMVKEAGTDSGTLENSLSKEGSMKNEKVDFKAVNYSELIPLLIKAVQDESVNIKEQNTIINSQNVIIKLQNEKIEALTELVERNLPNEKITSANLLLTSAEVGQNIPNPPRNGLTQIEYYIPKDSKNAQLVISDYYGKKIKQINLNKNEKGILNLTTLGLSSGIYTYTLYVNDKLIDTKNMIIAGH